MIGTNRWNLNGTNHDAPGNKPGDDAQLKEKKDRFPLVTCAELDAADYTPRPIITDCLYAEHPAIVGGLFKTCKSLISIDAAMSIASGRPFLNSFTVPEPVPVVYFSGEGGPSMIQEYGRRVAASRGLQLADVANLHWCFSVPRLEDITDLDEVKRLHDRTAAPVMFFDNLMLAMSGDEAGNVFKMGRILGHVIRICGERKITPAFVHHFKRQRQGADPYAPGELIDLTQAGPAEVAGQWLLLTRRERYDPDTPGEQKLWLSIGGRLGHGCLHALDIHEGRLSDPDGRRWDVEILRPDGVRKEANNQQAETKTKRKAEQRAAELETDRRELVNMLAKSKGPQTKEGLKERFVGGYPRFNRAFVSLVDDETFQEADVTKENNQTYKGWKLRDDSTK